MKKILILSMVGGALLLCIPIIFEPELVKSVTATGDAAVTLTVDEGISLTVPATADLVLNVPGNMGMIYSTVTNATDGATWNVKTNSQNGWKLEFNTATSDCLYASVTGERFADYTEASEGTPDAWSVTNAYEFGLNAEGTRITGGTAKWGIGDDCATQTDKKYMGFNSTAVINVGTYTTETNQAGENIIMCMAAQQHTIYAPNGSYSCTVTGTATSEP